ncbi:hypothetical protein [Nostoc sp.]|uniref:hypothetical protein n=1 Tax=Nostoc sp. TaxID=1180 RepID=UPI002FF427D5
MKTIDRKDAINRRQDERLILVETAIHRVSCLNRVFSRHQIQFPYKGSRTLREVCI